MITDSPLRSVAEKSRPWRRGISSTRKKSGVVAFELNWARTFSFASANVSMSPLRVAPLKGIVRAVAAPLIPGKARSGGNARSTNAWMSAGVAYVRRRQVHFCANRPSDVEAGTDSVSRHQISHEESCGSQHNDRDCDLADNQQPADAMPALPVQADGNRFSDCLPGRQQPRRGRGQQRHQRRVEADTPIEVYVQSNGYGHRQLNALYEGSGEAGECEAGDGPHCGEEDTLDEKLLQQSPPAGAERESDRQFSPPRRRARQQQPRHVDRCQQQHQGDDDQQQREEQTDRHEVALQERQGVH